MSGWIEDRKLYRRTSSIGYQEYAIGSENYGPDINDNVASARTVGHVGSVWYADWMGQDKMGLDWTRLDETGLIACSMFGTTRTRLN